MAAVAGATQYNVGGDNGWGVPGAGAESYNTWAEKTGFQIGDQLLVHCVSPPGSGSLDGRQPTTIHDRLHALSSCVWDKSQTRTPSSAILPPCSGSVIGLPI